MAKSNKRLIRHVVALMVATTINEKILIFVNNTVVWATDPSAAAATGYGLISSWYPRNLGWFDHTAIACRSHKGPDPQQFYVTMFAAHDYLGIHLYVADVNALDLPTAEDGAMELLRHNCPEFSGWYGHIVTVNPST